jgi:hypothetical protein
MKFDAKLFGKIGLAAAKVMVPQIAVVEQAVTEIKSGPDKKKAVLDTLSSSIELAEALSGRELLDQALLLEGFGEINDGLVKVMKAVQHREAQP